MWDFLWVSSDGGLHNYICIYILHYISIEGSKTHVLAKKGRTFEGFLWILCTERFVLFFFFSFLGWVFWWDLTKRFLRISEISVF